jgi:phosphate transport system substrate-binding protein
MRHYRSMLALAATSALAFAVGACGGDEAAETGAAGGGEQSQELSGEIRIDGSSTVFPLAEAAAELFRSEQPDVRVTVGQSGTGGGFEKFCAGETDISNASRPIKEDEEVPVCEKSGIDFEEVQVANDGVAVATNKNLDVDCLTTKQLRQIWNKGSDVDSLADVDPQLPDTELSLYGPGTDSGTFDFFTEEINGEEGVTREDYEPSEDDNQLVTGVAGDPGGMGYFGYSYYEQNQDQLNAVAIDGGEGCVEPTAETIQNGTYDPLARPIYMYPSKEALQRPEVKAFMTFMLENQQEIAEAAKMVPMTEAQATKSLEKLGAGA